MVFIGMDHGTTGISFCIMSDDGEVIDVFKIGREESKQGKVSAIEELSKRVDLDSIDLMAVTYAMGDGINKIQNITQVKNRGILSINGAGKVTGGGTSVFSEIEDSNIPAVMIPGLHKDSDSLDKLFRAAYSHQASPEKVSICYNAFLETGWKNMIVALFIGFLVGAVVMVIAKRVRNDEAFHEYPFGPFLALGMLIALFFGSNIINAYLSLIHI